MKFEETNSVVEAGGFKVATVIRVYENGVISFETNTTDGRHGHVVNVRGSSHTDGVSNVGLYGIRTGNQVKAGEEEPTYAPGMSAESVRSIDWCDPTDAEKQRAPLATRTTRTTRSPKTPRYF